MFYARPSSYPESLLSPPCAASTRPRTPAPRPNATPVADTWEASTRLPPLSLFPLCCNCASFFRCRYVYVFLLDCLRTLAYLVSIVL